MEEVAENRWRELREEIHRNKKVKVNWLHVAKAFSYTSNNVWFGGMEERELFSAFIRGRWTATYCQIKEIELLIESLLELQDPGDIEKTIKIVVCTLGDNREG